VSVDGSSRRDRSTRFAGMRYRIALLAVILISTCAPAAHAQDFSQFFALTRPGQLSLRLFGTGYGAERYATTHQGVELGQTLTHGITLVGRLSAYQMLEGSGFDSPLKPVSRSAVRNFGRLEGGISLTPVQGTTLSLLGGEDVGDSDAPVFENNLSIWLWLQSRHPINLSYSTSHFFENGVTNGLIDLRTVVLSTGRFLMLAGAGGAIWGGGTVGQAKGQGGPDLGFFFNQWRLSVDIQAGYGSSHTYGMVSMSHTFTWAE